MPERNLTGMRCGMFGKLAAKRDFIAQYAPRAFLDVWEPWMQSSMSASRQTLRASWQEAYLTAPIWRYWLGPEICGAAVLGAFMPSLDGVGRHYPLTVFASTGPDAQIPPPDIDVQDGWFAAAEAFLLATLDRDASFEQISGTLEQFPPPTAPADTAIPAGFVVLADGALGAPAVGSGFEGLFSDLRRANFASAYAAASFWWTVGGHDCPPLALSCRRMPDPFVFATMLIGRLPEKTANT